MKLHKFKVGASWGFAGANREDEIEFEMPDDVTPEEVENEAHKLAFEWACEFLDSWAILIPQPEGGKDETI